MINQSPLQNQTEETAEVLRAEYFESGLGTTIDKLRSVSRFIGRQEVAKLIGHAELLRITTGVAGSIADCGVYFGGGLMNYATTLSAMEPYNYQCRLIGFDTFSGDTGHEEIDLEHGIVDRKKFTYAADAFEDLKRAAEIYDLNRPLNHLPRIELVKGNLVESAPSYLEKNPGTIFRIIHLSVNLYRPTLETLKAFYPRLSKGGIVVIHGLNVTVGATQALFDAFEEFGIQLPSIRVLDYFPNITYFVKP